MLTSSLIYLAKYPFGQQARAYVKRRQITLDDLSQDAYTEVLDRAMERVEFAVKYGFVDDQSRDPETELLSFPLAVFIVAALENTLVARRYASAESERCAGLLLAESKEALEELGHNTFGLRIQVPRHTIGANVHDFSMFFSDYIHAAAKLKPHSWKLVNRCVHKGQVYLLKREIVRLIKSKVEDQILSKIEETVKIPLPPHLKEQVRKIRHLITERRMSEKPSQTTFSVRALPPCIKDIYSKLANGENLSHFARFTLTAFLLSLGFLVEDAVTLFSNSADFNERTTRYQIEHIAGKRGRAREYHTPSCRTLQTHGVCLKDETCEGGSNPARLYRNRSRPRD